MPRKPKIPENRIHYFMYGKTACGAYAGKRPAEWPPRNMFDIFWEKVNCKECLKKRPKGTTKEQYGVLRHTLGLQYRKNAFRNKYVDEPDAKIPNELVRKGMMIKGKPLDTFGGMCIYQATNFGTAVARRPHVAEVNGFG